MWTAPSCDSLATIILRQFVAGSGRRPPHQVLTHAPQQRTSLFEHLVSAHQERFGDRQAERLGGLEVDLKLELDRGLDGKLARLRALEDSIGIGRRAPKVIELVNSVGQQAAGLSEESARIDGREAVASCQRYDLCTMDVREGIWHHD